MNKLLSTLRKMQQTDKWPSGLAPEVLERAPAEDTLRVFAERSTQDILAEIELLDHGYEGEWAKVGRAEKRQESVPATPQHGRIDERVVAFEQFDAVAAEQYRKLYIELVHAGRVRALRTLLITSALAAEGKSLSALNLAITGATTGEHHGVLLIDTDFRKPSIPTYLGLQPRWGLADYLQGNVAYGDIFSKTQIPGLTLVAAGRRVSNPTTLIASAKMRQFVQDIRSETHYGHIIFDSSPVLSTSEPKALIQYVDATLLVVHAGKTPRDMVVQAMRTLGEENILGCVLNGLSPADFRHYRYYYSDAGAYKAQQDDGSDDDPSR